MLFLRFTLFNGNLNGLISEAFLWVFLVLVIMTLIYEFLFRVLSDWRFINICLIGFIPLTVITLSLQYAVMNYFHSESINHNYLPDFGLFIRSIYLGTLIYLTYLGGKRDKLKTEQINALKNQQAELKIDLLEQQINPHFLFNNLSILTTLIDNNNKLKATRFLESFSNVYRYVIEHRSQDFIPLSMELKMADDYLLLMKERFENQFIFEMDLGNQVNNYFIIPNTLHILFENIFKHNMMNAKNPLLITMVLKDGSLRIENQKKAKKHKSVSTGVGLKNLSGRYQLLMGETTEVKDKEDSFQVNIPLIQNY